MKKIFAVLLVIIFLCPVLSGFAAGEPTMMVSQTSAGLGEEATVTVSISDNPGIVGMTIGFEYDNSCLELLAIEESGLGGIWQKGTGIAWASDSGDSLYNGVFMTLTFRVLETSPSGFAEVAVKYSPGDICNNNLDDVNFNVVSGGVEVQSCSLSGMLFSWDSNAATVALYSSSVSDASIEKDISNGADMAIYVGETEGNADTQNFCFGSVKAGTYKFAAYKPDGYVVTIREVSVDGDVDMGTIKLWLYGDVVYDGVVDENDEQQLQRYTDGEQSVFGTGNAEDEKDRLKAAKSSETTENDEEVVSEEKPVAQKEEPTQDKNEEVITEQGNIRSTGLVVWVLAAFSIIAIALVIIKKKKT